MALVCPLQNHVTASFSSHSPRTVAHRLAERVGTSHRYRLTADGVRLGALLVKIRTRLLGPIFAAISQTQSPRSEHPSTVEAALRTVDHALDDLYHTLGLPAV